MSSRAPSFSAYLPPGAFDRPLRIQPAASGDAPLPWQHREAAPVLWTDHPAATIAAEPGIDVVVLGEIRARGARDWLDPANAADARRLGDAARAGAEPFLAEFDGPFLLLRLDRRRGELVAAIDRFGIWPLAHALDPSGALLLGASALWVAERCAARPLLEPQALFDYTHFHMVPSPGTAFRGVRKLEPAQLLRWTAGAVSLQRYWQPAFEAGRVGDATERREAMLEALSASVRRARSAHSATFLSGGIDSSTVTGLAIRDAGRPVAAYSMGFAAGGYDESHFARASAAHFGADLRQFTVVPDDVVAALTVAAEANDEPFGNSSALPTFLCARRAATDGMRRLLAGDGGDELFGGNTRYAKQGVFEAYGRIPAFLRRALIEPLLLGSGAADRLPGVRKAASYVRQARMPMPDRTESYNFLTRSPPAGVFEAEFLRSVDIEHPYVLLRSRYAEAPSRALVDRMLFLDWKFTLADNDLRKVGRMCELAGIEVRYPWLDAAVVEFSTTLRPSEKVRGGHLRAFAKEALTGFLPDEVLNKSKHGFGLPFGEWLKTSPPLQHAVYALLRSLARRGIYRADFIEALIREHRDGHAAYYGTMVWVLSMLEAWLASHRLAL